MPHHERRRFARFAIDKPVKMCCEMTGRFLGGTLTNMSAGGALIQVDHPSLLVPGQRVKLGVAWTRRHTVLKSEHLTGATIVRSLGMGKTQRVAVHFDHPQALAATA